MSAKIAVEKSETSGRIIVPPDLIAKLKEPLPSEAIGDHPTKTYLSTIKGVYVVERLNEVFGLGGWMICNEVIESDQKMVVVKSVFTVPTYAIYIESFGGNDNADRGDAYKGACTDALTKIGSYLYIGMDVYKGLHHANPHQQTGKPRYDEPQREDGAIEFPKNPKPTNPEYLISQKQLDLIWQIANAKGVDAQHQCQLIYKCSLDEIGKKAASALIDHLKQAVAVPAAEEQPAESTQENTKIVRQIMDGYSQLSAYQPNVKCPNLDDMSENGLKNALLIVQNQLKKYAGK